MRREILHRVIAPAALVALMGPAAGAPDAPLILRCTGYAAPLVVFPSLEASGTYQPRDPFDVVIDAPRGQGWFRGLAVSETRPGRLMTEPAAYRVEWRGIWSGRSLTEWVVVDRVTGTLGGHFTQIEGQPVAEHRRGGACVPLDRRF